MGSSQSEGAGQQTTHYRLIEERYLAFRDIEPGGSPVEAFLNAWPRLETHYGTMVEQLKSAIENALSIRCTVTARVKSLTSIEWSIKRRENHRKQKYSKVDEIFDDLLDLAGFRIVVDYPSGIETAKDFITQNFKVKSSNIFKADREVNDAWKPTFGSFQSENHHVVLHADARFPLSPFCGILFEIQILNLAESLYNRLAHPLLYKKSSGQLPAKDQKMIDVTHGLSICYWICLSYMEDRLEGKKTQDIPSQIQKVAQLEANENADMESFVKATPHPMPPSGREITIEKCLNCIKNLPTEAMSSDQLYGRLSLLLQDSSHRLTAKMNVVSGDIIQNYGSGSNNTYRAGGNITIEKGDIDDEIRKAFWVTDPQLHKSAIEERKGSLIEDSYRWILQDKSFTQWYQQDSPILWLNGDLGKGKTMSICGIINHISDTRNSSNTSLSYFFCDASDSNFNNATSVLRGIIYSLIFQNSIALSYVRERFKELRQPLSDPTLAWPVLQRLLTSILHTCIDQKTYLIIDALDECREDRDKLLEFIIKQLSLLPVKWLVSSRKWPVIREVLRSYPGLLELRLEDNETDVSAAVGIYITRQVESLSAIKCYDKKKKDKVERHLRSKANSTFLWVSLVCRMLKQIPAWQTMRSLDSFPTGLDALYGRMLEQIQPSLGQEGNLSFDKLYAKIISIALSAFRPLSLAELCYLIDDDEIDVSEFEEIIALCGSFLTIQQGVVYFIHDSAKEYLLNDGSGFMFNPQKQHVLLFSQSLSNLTRSLHRDMLYQESNQPLSVQDALGSFSYQCVHWVSHLAECESAILSQESMDDSSVDRFLRQNFLTWVEMLSHIKSVGAGISSMFKLERMLSDHTSCLKDLVQDQVRFIRYHKSGIEHHPLQIYASLQLSPSYSVTRKIYQSQAPDWFTLQLGEHEHWSPWLLSMEGHTDDVVALTFSHDGHRLASGSVNNTVKIWDVLTGTCLYTLLGHEDSICTIVFSTKNYELASRSYDNTIKIWDTNTGSLIRTLHGHGNQVHALAYSGGGRILALGSLNGTIKLFDTHSGSFIRTLAINADDDPVLSIAFTHEDQFLSCQVYGSVLIWDLKSHSDPSQIPCSYIANRESFVSSQTNELFFRDKDVIRILDPATKTTLRTINYPRFVGENRSIILSRDGTQLGIFDWRAVEIISYPMWQRIKKIEQSSRVATLSPTGSLLALSSDSVIKLWDLSAMSHSSDPSQHTERHFFSDDGSLVATSSYRETGVWESCTGTYICNIATVDRCLKAIFSPDNELIVLICSKEIYLGHVSRIDTRYELPSGYVPKRRIYGAVFSYDKRWLVFWGERDFTILDMRANRFRDTVEAPWSSYYAFSHDSLSLASYDGTQVKFYDTRTWECNLKLDGPRGTDPNNVVFSVDDRLLITTSDVPFREETDLHIWDLKTKEYTNIMGLEGRFRVLGLDTSTSFLLDTDFGKVEIVDHKIQSLVPKKYAISEDLQWILHDNERLLWLPPDYRPSEDDTIRIKLCQTCRKYKVAFVTSAKRTVYLELSC